MVEIILAGFQVLVFLLCHYRCVGSIGGIWFWSSLGLRILFGFLPSSLLKA
jgi:hypothetical protein